MSEHYDKLEIRSADERERDLASRLPALVASALKAQGWQEHLKGVDRQSREFARGARQAADHAQVRAARDAEGVAAVRRFRAFAGFLVRKIVHVARSDLRA
jgi:hypothetical protein